MTDPELGREIDLAAELPGRVAWEPPFERVEIEVQLPNRFRTVMVGRRLSPVFSFAVVCAAACGVAAMAVFVCGRVGASAELTVLSAAGGGVGAAVLGLIWLRNG